MRHVLQRHPLAIEARFEHCLVLTYAAPIAALRPLVPPGMEVDGLRGLGFVAAALVKTRGLRPVGVPDCFGQVFFLAGYRVFVKHRIRDGGGWRTLRGLRILRSDADRRVMVWGGNLLTHYNYRLCSATMEEGQESLRVCVRTGRGEADVDVRASWSDGESEIPAGSPFVDAREARRFAGPLPYTFDYEPQTHSVVRIKGVRSAWTPRSVRVTVREMGFIERGPLAKTPPVLASAFHVSGIPYRWERGVRERLTREVA